ncbi:unnamed protein product [Rhodiola kirilowii]
MPPTTVAKKPRKEMTYEELYPIMRSKKFLPSRFIDEEFLRSSGLHDHICEVLTASGWHGLISLHNETHVEDVIKFLASRNWPRGPSGVHLPTQRSSPYNQTTTIERAFWVASGSSS